MSSSPFFRLVDEVGHDPRLSVDRPKVFPNTRGLSLEPVDRPWARWEGGTLGESGVEVWRVRSTGHAIDLVGANRWSYHLPLRGGMKLTFGRNETQVREGDGALMGTRRRRTQVLAGGGGLFNGIVVLLDPAHSQFTRYSTDREDSGLVDARERGALSAYLRFLYAELFNPASTVHRPAALKAAGALLSELYATANASEAHGWDSIAPRQPGVEYVNRAEEVMRDRFAEPLTIPEVADAVGVGTRALQLAFASHRNASPREILCAMRLDAARDALMSARPVDTVTSIALACGFAHLGRFAHAYAVRFGEAPSETLRVRSSNHSVLKLRC